MFSIPTLEDFYRAKQVLGPVVLTTPVIPFPLMTERLGVPVYLKCENLQLTGSYKIRGAYNRLSRLLKKERECGVVAASAGNHAQGVALAAKMLDLKATIYMPLAASLPKYEATRRCGADIVSGGINVSDLLPDARAFGEKTGAIFVPPFDNPDLIAGQGTVGLEILEQAPEVQSIVVPVGGGGLISGVAGAAKEKLGNSGRIEVLGVQATGSASILPSLRAGEPRAVEIESHFADGIAISAPSQLTLNMVRKYVDGFSLVSDRQIARAMLTLFESAKLVAEPAGAAGLAALDSGLIKPKGPTVVVISGGNVDSLLMKQVIDRGLSFSWRRLTLRIQLSDVPGQLAEVSRLVANMNANVVAVNHSRHNFSAGAADFSFGQVFMDLEIETRGLEHSEEILESLRNADFRVSKLEG